eukprot:COSAG03_NODE_1241_length_4488_cov_6.137161_2_plen_587_part_00
MSRAGATDPRAEPLSRWMDTSHVQPSMTSSTTEEQYKREIVRVHTLYKQASAELQRKTEQLEKLSGGPGALDDVTFELKDRLRFSELQLQRERERSQSIQTNLDEVKMALSMCEAEMDRQAAERRVEAEQLLALRQQIKGLNDDKQIALDQAHQDLIHKDAELDRCKQRVQELGVADRSQRSELERLHETRRADLSKISVLEKQLASTDRRMRDLDRQKRNAEEELQRTRGLTHGVRAREQHLQERQRQVLADNNRLLKLLSRTAEYKVVAQDAKQAGGFAYISQKSTGDPFKSGGERGPEHADAGVAVGRAAMELQSWVPTGVVEAAMELRQRLDETVPAEELHGFLRAANRSWRSREKEKLRAAKQRHTKETAALRRQLSQRQPLVNVVQRVAGGYSVAAATQHNGDHMDSDSDDEPGGGQLTEGERRAAFLEGAVWFGYRTIEKTDKMGNKINTLTQQYYQSVGAPGADHKDLALGYVKDLDGAVLRCRTSVRRMFEDALVCLHANSNLCISRHFPSTVETCARCLMLHNSNRPMTLIRQAEDTAVRWRLGHRTRCHRVTMTTWMPGSFLGCSHKVDTVLVLG